MLKCRNHYGLISKLLPASLHFVNGFCRLKVVFVKYIKGLMSWHSLDPPYVRQEPPENPSFYLPFNSLLPVVSFVHKGQSGG